MEQKDALIYSGLEALKEGKTIAIVPQGISMMPFIKGGEDQVYLLKKETVEVGDIVLVECHGKYILHRVYSVDGEMITLMGDGNLKGTEVVDKSEVKGTAIEIIKPNGRCRKPHKAWLWRHTLPMRSLMLKVCRKWYKLWNS